MDLSWLGPCLSVSFFLSLENLIGPDPTGILNQTVYDYAIDFSTRAHQSEWNSAVQYDEVSLVLGDYRKDKLVSYDLFTMLDELIKLTTKVGLHI